MTELVNSINNGVFTLITPEEWEIITETIDCTPLLTLGDESMKKDRVDKLRQADEFTVKEGENYEELLFEIYHKELTIMLDKLNALDPQL
jgi:hypothetical protein